MLGLVEAGIELQPLRGWVCPHRSMTAWTATAVASSPSHQTPAWKRGSGRNAGTRVSCDWSTFWYVPLSPGLGFSCLLQFMGFRDHVTLRLPNPVLLSSRRL